jgi:cysteinyl-tRNA synthetase
MAEDKAAAAKKKDEPVLARAGESSDPEVQHLLARREIAIRNEDQDAADALTAELKEHGVA